MLVADLKDICLTTGIGVHASRVGLLPLDEFFELTGRPLSVYRYYQSHYAHLSANFLNHDLSKEQLLQFIISYNSLNVYAFSNLLNICAN